MKQARSLIFGLLRTPLIAMVFLFYVAIAHAQASIYPSSLDFGAVVVNTTSNSLRVRVHNGTRKNMTIVSAQSTLSEFAITGPGLPLTLSPGSNASFQITFQPDAVQVFSGSLVFVLNGRWSGQINVPVTGAGVSAPPSAPTPGPLNVSPTNLLFSGINVGSSASQAFTLSNPGSASITLTQCNVSGPGFSMSGLTLPLTLPAGQTSTFTVQFAPQAAGSVTGSISVVSNATNSPATIALSGTGIAATLQLTASPTSLSFSGVPVGSTTAQTVTITNTGNSSVTISQVNITGAGFSMNGLTTPLTLTAGQTTAFSVVFAPVSTGSVTGSITVVSNATNSPATVALGGTGVAATLQLTASPTSLSFSSVPVGSTNTQTVTLANTGNSSVSISQVNISGAGFSISGLTAPLTLPAGQSSTFTVQFAPQAAGSVTGSISVISNATNSPATVALSGADAQPISHSVILSWDPDTSVVAGYNVYRGTQPGGPYTMLNSSPVTATTYTDDTVVGGQTYYYVITGVDASAAESALSNEVQAAVPSP